MTPDPRQSLAERTLGPGTSLIEVAGDASTRRFFRATGPRGTAILMDAGEPLPADAPLFSNHRVLKEIGAPVPGIIAFDGDRGLALMEDFGDVSLQRAVQAGVIGPAGGPASSIQPSGGAGVP